MLPPISTTVTAMLKGIPFLAGWSFNPWAMRSCTVEMSEAMSHCTSIMQVDDRPKSKACRQPEVSRPKCPRAVLGTADSHAEWVTWALGPQARVVGCGRGGGCGTSRR